MNFGAKVLDDGWIVRVELDLCIASCKGAKLDPLGGENDWLRLCAEGCLVPEGEVITAGLGLALGAGMPGEGEGEALSKGFLRHRALPVPIVDMLPVPSSSTTGGMRLGGGFRPKSLGYSHDVSENEISQTSAHVLQKERKKGRKQQAQKMDYSDYFTLGSCCCSTLVPQKVNTRI